MVAFKITKFDAQSLEGSNKPARKSARVVFKSFVRVRGSKKFIVAKIKRSVAAPTISISGEVLPEILVRSLMSYSPREFKATSNNELIAMLVKAE